MLLSEKKKIYLNKVNVQLLNDYTCALAGKTGGAIRVCRPFSLLLSFGQAKERRRN